MSIVDLGARECDLPNGHDLSISRLWEPGVQMDPEDYTPMTERIEFQGDRLARYLRLELSQFNGGEIPEWHLGRWNPTWVFADEFEFDVEPVE